MKFNLVHSRNDGPFLAQFFQIRDGPVCDADGFCFAGFIDFFHLPPGFALVPGSVDGAGTVGVRGEEVACCVLEWSVRDLVRSISWSFRIGVPGRGERASG